MTVAAQDQNGDNPVRLKLAGASRHGDDGRVSVLSAVKRKRRNMTLERLAQIEDWGRTYGPFWRPMGAFGIDERDPGGAGGRSGSYGRRTKNCERRKRAGLPPGSNDLKRFWKIPLALIFFFLTNVCPCGITWGWRVPYGGREEVEEAAWRSNEQ